jgi:peptide-methionine (S)-S-oxide reductase
MFLLACSPDAVGAPTLDRNAPAPLPTLASGQAAAVFAGGCFWCMESDFDHLEGVVATTSGYIGGRTQNPTYGDVTSETTGHKEAVHVVYDTKKLSYDQVIDYYWRHVDVTDDGGQFCDRGDSYRPMVFVDSPAQKAAAEVSRARAQAALGKPIVVQIVEDTKFWPAEQYHQDFHETNPGRYLPYRMGCGRDAKLRALWGL